ncbi:hypothetical protein PVAND_009375 [Polypedilum vanderplanki]|uniref:Uncharacterized protein n=1 Tax=Polypedilum vanderplanki TaxID=319348 RepID=A0A9J6CD37_POLVA|nr:hypothetical protein PVAND_009375 [Polypedilum vanderplanki]
MSRIPEKTKVALLEKILESKKVLFDESLSKTDSLAEWNKISKISKKLGYNKTPNYLRTTFMYNQKTSAGRRLLANAPLTQAQKLTIGRNKISMGSNILTNSQETDADASDEDSSDDDHEQEEVVASVQTMKIDDNNNNNNASHSLLKAKRAAKRKSNDNNSDNDDNNDSKENHKEFMKLKKRKLMLQIEQMELQIKRAKLNNLATPDFAKEIIGSEFIVGENARMEEDTTTYYT